jgi:hypothetical protein
VGTVQVAPSHQKPGRILAQIDWVARRYQLVYPGLVHTGPGLHQAYVVVDTDHETDLDPVGYPSQPDAGYYLVHVRFQSLKDGRLELALGVDATPLDVAETIHLKAQRAGVRIVGDRDQSGQDAVTVPGVFNVEELAWLAPRVAEYSDGSDLILGRDVVGEPLLYTAQPP